MPNGTGGNFENDGEEPWTNAQQRLLEAQDIDSNDGRDVVDGVPTASIDKLLNVRMADELQKALATKGHEGVVTLDGSQDEHTQRTSTSSLTSPPWG